MAGNHQSSYTGAQLDAAIAAYQNRTAGTIGLTPNNLSGSIGSGYYSGVSSSLDYSSLTAEAAHVLENHSAIGKYGKISNGGIANKGAGSISLTPDALSGSLPAGYYSGVSAAFSGTGLDATTGDIRKDKWAVTSSGKVKGTLVVAAAAQYGTVQRQSASALVISGLTGSPSNVMIVAHTASSNRVLALSKIGDEIFCSGSTTDKFSVVFNSSAGTCTITRTSGSHDFLYNTNYHYVVW